MPSTTTNLGLYQPDLGENDVADELNANAQTLDERFGGTVGHTHAGTAGEGPKIPVTSIQATGSLGATKFLRGDGRWATAGGGGGVSDHDELTGLADDDHTQYYNQSRGDARYLQRSSNLSDLSSATTARTNLGAAAATHTHAASDLASGTIDTARLGSGTADSSSFLRGDQTWTAYAAPSTGLEDLTDVVITTPADNQVLTYDSASSTWKNEAAAGGGTLDALSDTTITTPSDGQVLTYDSGTSQWVNEALPGGGGAVATDAIWDAAGDLAVGAGANTAARLALGTDGDVLTVSGGGVSWEAPAGGTSVVGFLPFAYPPNMNPNQSSVLTDSMDAAGGAALSPILVTAPMVVAGLSVRNQDTTLLRTLEWRLYREPAGGGATLDEIAGLNGTDSFTSSGSSIRTLAATTPATIGPGIYWLVLRNTHGSNAWGVGGSSSAAATNGMGLNFSAGRDALGALGATLDPITSWVRSSNILAVRLNGKVFGQATGF